MGTEDSPSPPSPSSLQSSKMVTKLSKCNQELPEYVNGPRELSLELVDLLRTQNGALDREARQATAEVATLARERDHLAQKNATLRKKLDLARASLIVLKSEGESQAGELNKAKVLLASEKESRKYVEQELARCKLSLAAEHQKQSQTLRRAQKTGSLEHMSPTADDIRADVRRTLTGTVSTWVKGMQAECSTAIKEAQILPWLLLKVFFLCAELVEERREGAQDFLMDGGKQYSDKNVNETKVNSMKQGLRRQYTSLFPISGKSLDEARDKIMMSLARSMVDSQEWDPDAKDPGVVMRTLMASGLEKVVIDYLGIMVGCCLQNPPMTFTDDLGAVQRYDEEMHCTPLDGALPTEWCIVVFPSLVAETMEGDRELLERRYVLTQS